MSKFISLTGLSEFLAKCKTLFYTKPNSGIPASDLASSVQTSLGKADTAYQKPSAGIPASDLDSEVQTSLGKADSAIQNIKTFGGVSLEGTGDAVQIIQRTLQNDIIVVENGTSGEWQTLIYTNDGNMLYATFGANLSFTLLHGNVAGTQIGFVGDNYDVGINLSSSTYHILTLSGTSHTVTCPNTRPTIRQNLSYAKYESSGNKVTSWHSTPNDTSYPSEKLVKDYVDSKAIEIVEYNVNISIAPDAPICHVPSSIMQTLIPGGGGAEDEVTTTPDLYLSLQDYSSANDISRYSGVYTYFSGTADLIQHYCIVKVIYDNGTWSIDSKDVYSEIHPSVASSQPSGGFLPNVMYNLGVLSGNTTFALATPADANIVNHYYWTFDTGSTAPTITWPSGISWFGGSAPNINISSHYEISVLNNIAVFMEV